MGNTTGNFWQGAASGVITNPPTLSNYYSVNSTAVTGFGQIGVSASEWPFIQTFDLTIETFDVVYEQAGADEVVTLNFNSVFR
jgi:hypothetical protein